MSRHERIDLADGAWLEIWPACVEGGDGLLRLREELPLAPERYAMFGKEVLSPRLVSWHGDPGSGYIYSGVHHEPKPWTPALAELRERVEEVTGLTFNAVLANLYRDGSDGMGWHRDGEPEIGPTVEDRWVASLSLGAPRRFVLRHVKTSDTWERALGQGCLLVMRGTTQTHYRHRVPKTRSSVGARLNLTFRHMIGRS